MKSYVLALALAGYSGISFSAETYIGGAGASVCGSWSESRRSPLTTEKIMTEQMTVSWVMGFISAMNNEHAAGYPNFTSNFRRIGADGVTGWLDNYCKANPIDSISDAAFNLTLQILE